MKSKKDTSKYTMYYICTLLIIKRNIMNTTEFKIETEIGQTVYEIRINIPTTPINNSFEKEGIFVIEHKISFQTIKKIALNDDWITTFDRLGKSKRKESYQSAIGYSSISVKTNETYFSNGVFARLYTIESPKTEIKRLKGDVAKEIQSKYGFFNRNYR